MIAIIDFGLGNVNSVHRALKHLNIPSVVTKVPSEILSCEKIILPGVGSFAEASKRMFTSGMANLLIDCARARKKPLLGICLGMQLLAEEGEEGGRAPGLGLVKACVSRIRQKDSSFRLPHIGWNDVSSRGMKLFSGVQEGSSFYFVQSYEMILREENVSHATTQYGIDIVVAVKKDNVVGVQFHPEKSQKDGLLILKNFAQGHY